MQYDTVGRSAGARWTAEQMSSETNTGSANGSLEIHAKVWIERAGGVVISDFLAELLGLIAERGSLAAAAEALELPNRTAWKKLREMEAAAGVPLVTSESGGSEGGSTQLTPEAESIVASFHRVADSVLAGVDERFASERSGFPG
jgi:molybdate transport system regulatory protein